jgi:putative transposase
MDSRGRRMDNVFIERLRRPLKHECIYPHAFETGSDARAGIGKRMDFYNRIRPHSGMGGITPDMCHEQNLIKAA